MTKLTLPAADAPAEEWGALATRIPDWRWWWEHDKRRPYGLPGYRRRPGYAVWEWVPDVSECSMADEIVPDPDDPATAGCLLELLQARGIYIVPCSEDKHFHRAIIPAGAWPERASTLGRAAIAAAAAIGRWPRGGV